VISKIQYDGFRIEYNVYEVSLLSAQKFSFEIRTDIESFALQTFGKYRPTEATQLWQTNHE